MDATVREDGQLWWPLALVLIDDGAVSVNNGPKQGFWEDSSSGLLTLHFHWSGQGTPKTLNFMPIEHTKSYLQVMATPPWQNVLIKTDEKTSDSGASALMSSACRCTALMCVFRWRLVVLSRN